jgi:hypothetical protein
MKKISSQKIKVKQLISEQGFIGRNQCLAIFITRLGAIAHELESEGYVFEAGYTQDRKDYRYTLKSKPHVPVIKIVEKIDSNGKITRIAQYQ